jgi:hypothetical protein
MIERQYGVRIRQEAEALYQTCDANERRLVQFGMLPAAKAQAADQKLLAEFLTCAGRPATPREQCDFTRLLAVAVMDAANRGPDQVAL